MTVTTGGGARWLSRYRGGTPGRSAGRSTTSPTSKTHQLEVDRYRQLGICDGVVELTDPFPLRLDLRALD